MSCGWLSTLNPGLVLVVVECSQVLTFFCLLLPILLTPFVYQTLVLCLLDEQDFASICLSYLQEIAFSSVNLVMALSYNFSSYQASASITNDHRSLSSAASYRSCIGQRRTLGRSSINNELFGQQVREKGKNQCIGCSFLGRTRSLSSPIFRKDHIMRRKGSVVYASFLSGIPSSEIASTAFTWGTAAVLPFYTCMVVAPKTEFAKKVASSSMPYIVLGTLYCYLLYLSWTPDTIRLMFASKYWLPELPGMANLFSSEMTLASAWIHLLAVDLFAARQVYHDGLRNNIETRHSVTLCLMSCPIGILAHLITKTLSRNRGETEHRK